MHDIHFIFLTFMVSLVVASLTFKPILYIARKYRVYDNPDWRKLQRRPIPVMGGFVVFMGFMAGILSYWFIRDCTSLIPILVAMTIMLIVGSYDDKKSLSPYPKFVIEILLVLLLALLNNGTISSLHGLFGVYHITPWIAWPLTLIACVGIINAINLIDGVDGLSSGMCIMALALFSWIFIISHDWPHAALGCALTGGLIPFFIMNVFGNRSKMFIGDSGTLMLGIAICYMVMTMLKEDSLCKNIIMGNDVSLEAFVLAVLAIPVFDTVRVMFGRIFRGVSPFRPDKTHLHHAFIDYGFHHLETALLEIITNMVIVLTWFVLSFSYLPRELHLLGVAALSILCTFGLYWMLGRKKRISKKGEKVKSEE